jgi:hypothetical protein
MTADRNPERRTRRGRSRHRRTANAAFYARLEVVAIAVVLAATFAWQGFEFLMHRFIEPVPTQAAAARSASVHRPAAPWQTDVLESLGSAAEQVQAGNVMEAEMAVDRGASLIEAATVSSRPASSDFFEMASAGLDGVIRLDPQNSRLLEHVTLARIELAQLRSHLAEPLEGDAGQKSAVAGNSPTESKSAGGPPGSDTQLAEHVADDEPRTVAADHVFGPAQAGGDWLDASNMADSAEVLLPPSSRLLVDNVRVENLTIEGAAQTLDGIHWGNVTFVGTRIRYEGGEVDLRNVHFVRCTFGVSTDEHGSRLANAVALGQASIVIN